MAWSDILNFAGRVFKGIVSILVENGKLSIGRLLLISVFILAIIKWSQNIDLTTSMLTVLMSLLAYIMGSKVIGNVTDTIQSIKGGEVKNKVEEKEGGGKTPDVDNL